MVACSRASSQLAIRFEDSQHVQKVATSFRIRGQLVLELFGSTGLSQLMDRVWTFGGIVSVSDSSLCQGHVVDHVWNTHQRAICGQGGHSLFDSFCLASVLVGEWRSSRGAYCVRDSVGVALELVSKRCLNHFAAAGRVSRHWGSKSGVGMGLFDLAVYVRAIGQFVAGSDSSQFPIPESASSLCLYQVDVRGRVSWQPTSESTLIGAGQFVVYMSVSLSPSQPAADDRWVLSQSVAFTRHLDQVAVGVRVISQSVSSCGSIWYGNQSVVCGQARGQSVSESSSKLDPSSMVMVGRTSDHFLSESNSSLYSCQWTERSQVEGHA